jgi:ankyrin repeat protein
MKFVFSSMTRERNNRHGVIASFFFNARGTKLERSTLGMYRSLLLQLLKGYTDLQAVLDDQKPIAKSQDCPSLPDLKVLLDRAVLSLGQRPFTCFVDALDECDEQQAMDMAFSFEQLSELAASEEIPLRICFSSRHYPDFDIQRGIRVILENQQGHADDLKKYVEAQLRIRDHTLKKDLEARIIQKAAGVFLWIVLVVGILNRHMRRGGQQPKKRLVEIPSGLSALFKDILTRDDENMAEFRLCVLWILCAKEPLGAESLLHAVWSGLYLEGQADSEPPDLTTAAGFVTGSSKGLAEVMDQSGFHRVQFIHESVPDFLIKDHGLRELWPKLGPNWESLAHETLKKCCEAYMRYYLMCESTRNKLKRLETKEKYPFLMYASYHVLAHADAAAYAIPQGDFLSRFALRDWRTIINMTRLLPVEIYTSGTNLTWFLVEKGYSELIRAIPKQDRNHPSGCRFSVRHPLLGALLWGRKDAAAALLDLPSTIHNGVDIVEGLLQLHSSDYTGHTPLSFAAERGRIDLVELLLNDANIDEVDDDGQTALSRALCRGHEHVARLLIDRGAAITGGSRDKLTSLLLAVCNGYDGITRLLVEKGADVKPRGGDDRPLYTHISRSPRLDFEAIAKLVIEDGANINAMYPGGERPLYIALDRCHEGMVRLLIENGANIDAWYLLGKKPLDIALDRCHEGIVRLLIEKGVDVNARGWGKKTALIRASEQGHEDIVRLLIEKGADVNACGLLDNTALTIASEQGHEGIVRLLIENGVDLHGRGLGMMTALMRASKKGHEDIVRLLIENAR